ncbi:MAG: 1,4-dihydroxy-6-naphthoate synthase [Saprospiraceae bacterium]|nr:1,4-dihydroxy-6-naphthoate synthase [Saprospiraceae bacterium]
MNLRLGFSPCPNDTFIFHALLHELVQGPKVHWEPHLEDVETLNQWALEGRLDVTKLSFHAYAKCSQHYQLLNTGAALGFGCGPLVIARHPMTADQLEDAVIAIPGELTTANFLFQLAYPLVRQRKVMPFSEIENAVLEGRVDAGVIIHENRFTYAQKGLTKLMDLGEYWESETGLPIPLGGIFVRRDLPVDLKMDIQKAIGASVRYALDHPTASASFIQCHAQEMDPEVTRQHIDLYVNEYSADLGETGQGAVRELYAKAVNTGIIPLEPQDIFCPIYANDL